jgi:DNA-binding MarR family transcriptional regulator
MAIAEAELGSEIDTKMAPDTERELILLEQIENDPDVTQASLASKLGVAVGTVNWHLKRLVAKGYVKVKRAQRRKLRYIITPEGLALRAHLTVNYIENSMRLYRKVRQRVVEVLNEASQAGYRVVRIEGDGDIADICRLTCLEQGFKVLDRRASLASSSERDPENRAQHLNAPVLEVRGTKVILHPPVLHTGVLSPGQANSTSMEAK